MFNFQTVQIITSPAGEEMVVISKKEFDALAALAMDRDEDAADVAIYDARKAELAEQGEAGLLPAAVSLAVLRGETRLKAIRKHRTMSQQQVAAKAGIAQGFLSDLENGHRNITDAVADSLAAALDVPADWLRA